VNVLTLVKTFSYPAYATEDLIESWSGTAESPSLKKILTCSRNTCIGRRSAFRNRVLFLETGVQILKVYRNAGL
jgi:hypothetical protein